MKHCGVDLPRITDEERSQAARAKKPAPSHLEPSQPTAPNTSGSTERSRSYERGRPPPSASSSSAVIDDEDEPAPSKPIERERKPYSAHPGGGKKYEETGHTRSRTESFSSGRPLDVPSSATSHRHSTSDKYSAADGLYSSRTGSGTGHPRRRYSRGSRSSSRGMSHDYRHSESDLLGRDAAPPRYGGVSTGDLYTDSPTSILPEDDVRRYREHHRGGSRASEDEYYRGLLGGQGGGPVHEHKRYH